MTELIQAKVVTVKNVWFVTIVFFLNNGFKYQDSVCNCCHDLIMLCLSINNMAIITGKGIDYYCIIHDITKSEVIHLLEN